MTPQDQALRPVINHLTEWVRERGRLAGAQIGAELARTHPGFDLHDAGFSSVTDLLDRAAHELSIVGRSGTDFIWSTYADLELFEPALDDDLGEGFELPLALLERFSARRFKSLAEVDIPLRPFNVIVGANGAGKTSVLEGMWLLSQFRYKKPATIFANQRSLSRLATVGRKGPVELRMDVGGEYPDFIEYRGTPRPDQLASHILRVPCGDSLVDYDYANEPITGEPPRELPLLLAFGGTTLLRLDARRLAQPSISATEQPALRYDGHGLPSVLANLAATDRDRLDRIFAATREIIAAFDGARMPRQRIPSPPQHRDQHRDEAEAIGVGLELKLHGHWLDSSLASEGTLLVLGLMTIVHGLRSSRLLLLDDIERALHPKAQRALAEQLAAMTQIELGFQIVCTTHSPYLLDAVDPEDVLVVRASPDEGLTRCRRLVEHEAWDKWRSSMSPGEFWS